MVTTESDLQFTTYKDAAIPKTSYWLQQRLRAGAAGCLNW